MIFKIFIYLCEPLYLIINELPMKILILKEIVRNSGSNEEGVVLFNFLRDAYLKGESVILKVDSELSMSSSFLNSSIGHFLDDYGLDNFKKTVKFKGNKNQFSRLVDYINKYSSLYPV